MDNRVQDSLFVLLYDSNFRFSTFRGLQGPDCGQQSSWEHFGLQPTTLSLPVIIQAENVPDFRMCVGFDEEFKSLMQKKFRTNFKRN